MQGIVLSNGVEFDFLTGDFSSGDILKSYSAKIFDDIVHVSWSFGTGGSTTYSIESVVQALSTGGWKVVGEIRNVPSTTGRIYQVGFADGTWRDVSEVTFNEAKTWPSTHATRIIRVI